MAAGVYSVVTEAQSVSTAITLLEVAAPATAPLRLLRAWLSQSNLTASARQRVRLLRKTGTITGTATPPTARPLGAFAASGTVVKHIATAEGTDGDTLAGDAFDWLNGWLWIPVPEERIIVPPSGLIAIKLPAAPGAATTLTAGLTFEELG